MENGMNTQPVIIVICDGGGKHQTKPVTVAAFRKINGKFWSEIKPDDVRRQYAEGQRSGIPALDALRHVTRAANQEVLGDSRLPWGTNWDKLLDRPEQGINDRLTLDCVLCRRRKAPNTLTIAHRIDEVLDGIVESGNSIVTIDRLRLEQGSC